MTIGYMDFAGIYLIVAVLLLLILIPKKVHIFFKILAIPAVLFFCLFVYSAPFYFAGWPTSELPADQAIVSSYSVVEPYPGFDGAIYVIIINKDNRPRLHQLPYSRNDHETAVALGQAVNRSRVMVFNRGKEKQYFRMIDKAKLLKKDYNARTHN